MVFENYAVYMLKILNQFDTHIFHWIQFSISCCPLLPNSLFWV